MDGGHGDGVVFFLSCRKPLTEPEGMQVTLEVAVQEAVEDGVDADGAHGSQMAQQEQGVVGTVHGRFVVPVDDSVEDVERQPADSEGHHDGEQHDVDTLCLVAAVLVLTHSLHHTLPLPQTDVDLGGEVGLRVNVREKEKSSRMRKIEKGNILFNCIYCIWFSVKLMRNPV